MVLGFLLSLSLILLLVGSFLTPVHRLYLPLRSFVFLFAVALSCTESPRIVSQVDQNFQLTFAGCNSNGKLKPQVRSDDAIFKTKSAVRDVRYFSGTDEDFSPVWYDSV